MLLKRIGIILAACIPVAIVGALAFMPENNESTETPEATAPSAPTESAVSSAYNDGTYTAEGPYRSPMGSENITVALTVADDTVTAVSVTPHGVEASAFWQGKFVSGVQTLVVGKRLTDLQLTNVSGSSLTPIGFNVAVEAIRAQAKM